jgi:hypothetical protein
MGSPPTLMRAMRLKFSNDWQALEISALTEARDNPSRKNG